MTLLSGFVKSALFQFLQTGYDTIVFVLIVFGTARIAFARGTSARSIGGNGKDRMQTILTVIASQGVLYYG